MKKQTSRQACCHMLRGMFAHVRRAALLASPPPTSPGVFYLSKIINKKRGNDILNRAASPPLAHLPRPLTLQEYFSFNLSPWCHKHGSSNLFLPAAIKIIPLISQNHGKLAPLTIFFSGPVFLSRGCRRMNNLWSMEGSPFLHADSKS